MMTNSYTPYWFAAFADTLSDALTEREVQGLSRWIPLPDYRNVLDVCCGAGRHAERLARLGHTVTGVDRDAVALAQARESAPCGNFVQLDQRNIQQVGGTYDAAIILWQSFGYFGPAGNDDVLRQISALLRPGGRLVLDLYHPGYIRRHQGRRADVRPGVVAITDRLIGSRLRSTIEYEGGVSEEMDFELFSPDVLARRASPFGFIVAGACCWWDHTRPPNAESARYQILLQRQT